MNAGGYRSPRAAPGGTAFSISARSSAVRFSAIAGSLGQPLAGASADQRHDVLALCGHPCDGQLGGGAARCLGDAAERRHEGEVVFHVPAREPRAEAAEVAGAGDDERAHLFHLAGVPTARPCCTREWAVY
jgi:hypothetical protein